MNVSDQIIQVLDNLCEKFGFAIDWTSENILPYLSTLCNKLISYEIWTSVAWIIIAIIIGITCLIILTKPNIRDRMSNGVFEGAFARAAIILLSIFSIACIVMNTMDIIKCVTFPEMYIFEYVQRVLNSGG